MGGARRYEYVGGHLGVDFVNSLGGTFEAPHETLDSYSDLLAWTAQAGLLADAEAGRLRRQVESEPERAEEVLGDARRLRSQLDMILRATVAQETAPAEPLAAIRDAYVDALRSGQLVIGEDGRYDWAWVHPADDLANPLWRVAAQVVDLLRTGRFDRLTTCAECRWLFLDLSRNRSRRWCRMSGCGARAKMRRYRASRSGQG